MPNPSSIRRGVLLGALAIAVVAAASYAAYVHFVAPRPALRLYGNVDIRDVNLAFRVAGRVQRVLVDEGDAVQAGQRVAELDPVPAQRDVAEAAAAVESSDARLALLVAGNRKEDVAQAAAAVDERQAALANAEQELARENRLAGTGASTAERQEQARAARDQASARLAAARQAHAELQRGFRREEIAEARANLERAKAALEQARLRLDDTRLAAPSAGVVLTRAIEPGAMVAAGTTVLVESLVQPVWVRAYVRETELAAAKPGTPVDVRADSLPGKVYGGRVGFVSPTAEFTPKSVETPDLRTDLVYRLRIVVDDPSGTLRQGMPVTVDLKPAA
ncbi:MAG TPA: secretion protein HlyD [Burkholderiaceae bacterium]|nr:secretion protein HlyD [Burkholderiaceae bacterium]